MNIAKRMLVAAVGALSLVAAGPCFALALVAGTGWQADQIDNARTPSEGSPIVFTVPTGHRDLFSLTDCCVPGDSYTVTYAGVTVFSTFTLYPTPFVDALGDAADFAGPWLDRTFSHLQLAFAPGSYALVVEGDGVRGLPASFGVRLDDGAGVGAHGAVPEPATWAAMLLGFGGIGATLRRRRNALAYGTATERTF